MSPAWGMTVTCKLLNNICKKQTRPSEALLVQWIKTTWNGISAKTFANRFKKFYVPSDTKWKRR
jgi:hypothetical protein